MARPKDKKSIQDGSASQRLLNAAADLFVAKGYAGTAVREIVAAAGVSKPVLYYYFKSKDGIYLALMERLWNSLTAVLNTVTHRDGPASNRILDLMTQLMDIPAEQRQVVRLIHAVYFGQPQGTPYVDYHSFFFLLHQALTAIVADGVAAGEFADDSPQDMAWALLSVFDMVVDMELCPAGQPLARKDLPRLVHLIFNGIMKKPQDNKGKQR
jgi:AcrR family transcriptional regulator